MALGLSLVELRSGQRETGVVQSYSSMFGFRMRSRARKSAGKSLLHAKTIVGRTYLDVEGGGETPTNQSFDLRDLPVLFCSLIFILLFTALASDLKNDIGAIARAICTAYQQRPTHRNNASNRKEQKTNGERSRRGDSVGVQRRQITHSSASNKWTLYSQFWSS